MGKPSRYTGKCRACGHRVLITPRSGVIRSHLRLDGTGECEGSMQMAAPRSARHRSEAPPDRLRPALQNETTRRMLEFPCDVCLANPQQGCVTIVKRRPTTDPHTNRYTKAVAAGRLPIRDES